MKGYKMWIDGKWVDAISGKTYTVVNPVTEEKIAEVPLGDKKDVDKAVESAQKAFPKWSKTPVSERARILNKIAASIRDHFEDLIAIDILDHGTPVNFAKEFVQLVAHHFEYAAEVSSTIMGTGESSLSDPNTIAYLQREPIGVCAGIIPWNVPLMVTAKIAPAIAAGNTCIIKPPSVDSLPGLKIAEIIAEHDLPPGVVNFVTGPGSTVGEALSAHPGVSLVSFTGGGEAGKAVMAAASSTVKRLCLELGGKNPFIVLDDANLDTAVVKGVFCLAFNSGMICGSPGRYYIHEKIYDEFVSRFVDMFRNIIVGNPNDEKTQMGPVVSSEHRDKIESFIKSGIEQGATLLLGGKRPVTPPLNKGFFVMPTVFGDVKPGMKIYSDEIFGPVACMIKFSSDDDVLKMANDNNFGLAASVWTRNLGKGRRFASDLQAGTVWINDHMGGAGEIPWGGFKESGYGKDSGRMGFEEYTQVKVVSINTAV